MRDSILLEEPIGLLGNAALLDQSDISEFVSAFHLQHPEEDKLREFVSKNYTVANSKCYLEEGSRRIRVEDLAEKTSK
jgi:hypothetical protein